MRGVCKEVEWEGDGTASTAVAALCTTRTLESASVREGRSATTVVASAALKVS